MPPNFEPRDEDGNISGCYGAVAELADAGDLKSSGVPPVWVRVPPAPLARKDHVRVGYVSFLPLAAYGLDQRLIP